MKPTDGDPQQLIDRVRRLERQSRVWKPYRLAILVAFGLLFAAGVRAQQNQQNVQAPAVAPAQQPKFEIADVHASATASGFVQTFGGVIREGRYVNRDVTLLKPYRGSVWSPSG